MTARRLVTIPANEVEFRRPRFLLEGRIPFGAVTIVAGEPDAGKTTLLALLGAQTTRGTIAGDLADPASVLFVSTEDSPAFTLGPRVAAAGADLARIHFLQHVLDGEVEDGLVLPRDLQALEQTIVDQGVWLVVLDPISATIDGKLDTHRDQHVRIVLGRLAALAERQNIAVVAIMHYKKGTESTALNQIGGSVAFGAAARSVLLFGADPDDESDKRRLLVHIKCNVGPKQRTLAFHRVTRVIEGANELVEAPFLQADGESEVTGAELLSKDDEPAARREAREFWLAELADGPVATVELKRRAEAAGLAWRTLERVVRNLGVQSVLRLVWG
jgi:predicted ATP-dependent serine protease